MPLNHVMWSVDYSSLSCWEMFIMWIDPHTWWLCHFSCFTSFFIIHVIHCIRYVILSFHGCFLAHSWINSLEMSGIQYAITSSRTLLFLRFVWWFCYIIGCILFLSFCLFKERKIILVPKFWGPINFVPQATKFYI